MAYTAPATWTTGHVVTAAELNQELRDNLIAIHDNGDFANNVIHLASIYGASASNKDFIQYNSGTGFYAPHTLALSDLPAGGAAAGDLLMWNGSAWAKKTIAQTLGPAWSLDTVYQNTGGSPLFATMSVQVSVVGVSIATIGQSIVTAQVSSSNPPITVAATAMLYVYSPVIETITQNQQLFIVVPPGYYFRFASTFSTSGIQPVVIYTAQWQL
jgi:hypothetical protein